MSRHVPTFTCKVTPGVAMQDTEVDNLLNTFYISFKLKNSDLVHRAGSDGSMSASGSIGPAESKFYYENFET